MNTLKHRPIDFTVPLLTDFEAFRTLWSVSVDGGNSLLHGLPPLDSLRTLDLFSEITSREVLAAQGVAAQGRLRGLVGALSSMIGFA